MILKGLWSRDLSNLNIPTFDGHTYMENHRSNSISQEMSFHHLWNTEFLFPVKTDVHKRQTRRMGRILCWIHITVLLIYSHYWSFYSKVHLHEPRHDKTNKVTVRPAKTQISVGIRPVWSDTLLCTQWVAKDPSFFMRTAKTDETGRMPRLFWVIAGRTIILLVLLCRGLHVVTEWTPPPGRYRVLKDCGDAMSRDMTKTNKMGVRTAKTRISLGIRPVWSEPSLCAQWEAKDPSFLHADSEESDQTGRWSESSLVAHPFCWFCHVVAYILSNASRRTNRKKYGRELPYVPTPREFYCWPFPMWFVFCFFFCHAVYEE